MRSVGDVSELLGSGDDFNDGVAALDGVVLLLGDFAYAWPAVLLDGQSPLHAVQIGGLVLALFLGGLLAILEG